MGGEGPVFGFRNVPAGAVREGATSLAGRDLRYIGHRRGCAADSRLSGMVVKGAADPGTRARKLHEGAGNRSPKRAPPPQPPPMDEGNEAPEASVGTPPI